MVIVMIIIRGCNDMVIYCFRTAYLRMRYAWGIIFAQRAVSKPVGVPFAISIPFL